MAKYKHKTYYQVKEIFTPNKYKQFKKGELYRDPRIQQQGGQKDFLILSNKEADFEMLESYLKNELVPRYPSEPYNMFTTGCDSNGTPMIGLYWMDESMDQKKVAIILCNDGCEESVLAIVDDNCLEMGEKRVIDKLNEEDVKTNVGNELVRAAVNGFQHPNLAKYQKTK